MRGAWCLKPGPRARGFTVAELVITTAVVALLLAIALPRLLAALDRVRVRAAAADIAAVFAAARDAALESRSPVSTFVDSASDRALARWRDGVLVERRVGAIYGVEVRANRDSMTYDPRGLGFGAANLSVIVWRGAAAETVFVSRLGRVRR